MVGVVLLSVAFFSVVLVLIDDPKWVKTGLIAAAFFAFVLGLVYVVWGAFCYAAKPPTSSGPS